MAAAAAATVVAHLFIRMSATRARLSSLSTAMTETKMMATIARTTTHGGWGLWVAVVAEGSGDGQLLDTLEGGVDEEKS